MSKIHQENEVQKNIRKKWRKSKESRRCNHTIHLHLNGSDNVSNVSGLDQSVNRSLGSQIQHRLKNLPTNTKIRNKMKELNKQLQEKIDQLENEAGDLFSNNDVEKAYKLREEAWTLYPEPKIDYSDAYNTAKYIVEEAFVLTDLNRAKIWLNKMIEINNNLHISDDELEYYLGRYYFETKDFQKALLSFDEVIKETGFRYFEDEDPKYLDFYKNPKKYTR